MFKFRNLVATGLVFIVAFFAPTSMLWAKSKLTPKQERAKSKCSLRYMSCVDACGVVGLTGYWDCQTKCEGTYNRCMDAAGIPLKANPPPKTGDQPKPTGIAPVPTSTTKTPTKQSGSETISQ